MKRPKVLFIDDEESILGSFKRLFRKESFDIFTTTDAKIAIKEISSKAYSVIVSDQRMPDVDGAEVLRRAKEASTDTIRIMLTGYADIQAAIRAVNDGNIFRFLSKPWNEDELRGAIHQAIEQHRLILENQSLLMLTAKQNKELVDLNQNLEIKVYERTQEVLSLNKKLELAFLESIRIIGSLTDLTDLKRPGHAKRVATLSGALAKKMQMSDKEVFQVLVAGYVCDIGGFGLSHPDPFSVMNRGLQIIKQIPNITQANDYVRSRFENYDGSGLLKLSSSAIPLGARIIHLVDAYDDLLNTVVSSVTITPQKVLDELKSEVGKKYDPTVFACLENYLREHNALNIETHESQIELYELRKDMILSRPLHCRSGRMLLGADFRVDSDTLERIWKHHKEDPVEDTVYIYKKSQIKKAA